MHVRLSVYCFVCLVMCGYCVYFCPCPDFYESPSCSLHPYVCPSVRPSTSFYPFLFLSLSPSLCLSVSVSLSLSLYYFCFCFCLSLCLSVCPCLLSSFCRILPSSYYSDSET